MRKKFFALFFIFLLIASITLVSFGCKKVEKEKPIEQTAEEISQLITEIEQLDVEIDLGNETLSEESELI